jgi:CubicO group peptidase (beta-lactamase class C family)
MCRSFRLGAFLLILFVLASCGPAVQTTPPTIAPAPTVVVVAPTPLGASLDELFTDLAAKDSFSGAVLIMQGDEVVLRKGYGYADREAAIANTPETAFRIGGLTKPFTAVGILLLEAQGKLSVDDPICTYLADCPEAWQAITLHHLLSNTSGIVNYVPATGKTPAELAASVYSKAVHFAPGDGWEISQTNYALLGLVIEQVSGQSYADFLETQIFAPLGISATGVGDAPDGAAVGYAGNIVARPPAATVAAANGLYSTVDDLYRWDQALRNDALLSAAQREKLLAVHYSFAPDPFTYGYSIIASDTYLPGHRLIGFGLSANAEAPFGVYSGFDSSNWALTDLDTTVIMLSNQERASIATLDEMVADRILAAQE